MADKLKVVEGYIMRGKWLARGGEGKQHRLMHKIRVLKAIARDYRGVP